MNGKCTRSRLGVLQTCNGRGRGWSENRTRAQGGREDAGWAPSRGFGSRSLLPDVSSAKKRAQGFLLVECSCDAQTHIGARNVASTGGREMPEHRPCHLPPPPPWGRGTPGPSDRLGRGGPWGRLSASCGMCREGPSGGLLRCCRCSGVEGGWTPWLGSGTPGEGSHGTHKPHEADEGAFWQGSRIRPASPSRGQWAG